MTPKTPKDLSSFPMKPNHDKLSLVASHILCAIMFFTSMWRWNLHIQSHHITQEHDIKTLTTQIQKIHPKLTKCFKETNITSKVEIQNSYWIWETRHLTYDWDTLLHCIEKRGGQLVELELNTIASSPKLKLTFW